MKPGRVIVVTGLPGTGKSTLAQELATRYRMPVFAKDFIKEALLDVLGATDAAESRRLSDASFAALFRLAEEWARGGHGFILEGNFRAGEHEVPLRRALASAQVAQVLCRIPETERVERLARRANDSGRHAGHRFGERARSAPGSGLAGTSTIGTARADAFLDFPSERFAYEGHGYHTVLTGLDDWMNLRAASLSPAQSSEPSR